VKGILVFSGNANKPLAEEICHHLKLHLGEANTSRFSDGEFNFQILQNVRGADVFIIQPTCPPVDASVMELLIMLDALRRSSADRITAVIPYYGYARKDRKDKPRVPISSKLIANLITAAGAHRILTMDLHAGQIQGFFDIPVDHLYASPVFVEYFQKKDISKLMVVSPDMGGAERARAYARHLGVELAIADKRREKDRANVVEVMNIVGDVRGRNTLIIDDIVDTAGSLTQVAAALKNKGAEEIYACCSHAVLSGPAIKRIMDSPIKELVVTNSIPLKEEALACPKIVRLSIAKLLAEAICSIHDETSVSKLFI
jgi:ribose-phosphate pyrophosphokinase